jgi:two-component system, NtrC family, nitrogen regulation response regulator GlnG
MPSASDKPVADASTGRVRHERTARETELVVALTIAAHPIASRAGDRHLLRALHAGREELISRNEPDFTNPGSALGAPLADPFISRKPIRFAPGKEGSIRVIAGEDGTRISVGGSARHAFELTRRELELGVPIELADRVLLWLHLFPDDSDHKSKDALEMVGESAGIRRVRRAIERVADLHVPVLIRGETGSGKELVARAIHRRGRERDAPFISVNLGAIPKELAAAELFGAQKGAFTGATRDRLGFFGAAHGGTLFLDEVAEAPPEVQVMLLRVLETGEMFPIGGHTPIPTDVRLITATDADLELQIRDGRFRAPLLHRLAGYEIHLPPLRERREDIGPIFYHFAREELGAIGELERLSPPDPYADAWLPASIAARLVCYSWPGNIRQLRNVARQMIVGSRGRAELELDPRLAAELDASAMVLPNIGPAREEPAEAERRKPSDIGEAELLEALRAEQWDIKRTADRLGVPRSSIYDMIERSPNVRTAGDLDAEEITACHRTCAGDLDAMVERLQVSRRALGRRVKELGLDVRRRS